MRDTRFSRRTFLNALASTAAVSAVPAFAASSFMDSGPTALAAVSDGVRTLRLNGGAWHSVYLAPAIAPSALALSANAKLLHVANETDRCNSLPTGSVTTYRVSGTGALLQMGVAPLALSATRPCSVALAPAGDLLVVASEGGVLSLLEMDSEGFPGAVVAARKHLTREPLSVRFDRDGLLFVTQGEHEQAFHVSRDSGFMPAGSSSRVMHQAAPALAEIVPGARSVLYLPSQHS